MLLRERRSGSRDFMSAFSRREDVPKHGGTASLRTSRACCHTLSRAYAPPGKRVGVPLWRTEATHRSGPWTPRLQRGPVNLPSLAG